MDKQEEITIECGDCGDELILSEGRYYHKDDNTPACHSRSMANRRRDRQGRSRIGEAPMWNISGALWQTEHGEPGTQHTEAAWDYLERVCGIADEYLRRASIDAEARASAEGTVTTARALIGRLRSSQSRTEVSEPTDTIAAHEESARKSHADYVTHNNRATQLRRQEAAHCRTHPEFRSDCPACVIERQFS